MGMYTQLVLGIELKKDTSEQVINALGAMLDNGCDPFIPDDHPLWKSVRWHHMLRCDSYYFDWDTHSAFRYDKIAKTWMLTVCCNLKNYDDEINLFLDWLQPYIETQGFLGFKRYEENEHPTLIYNNGGIQLVHLEGSVLAKPLVIQK